MVQRTSRNKPRRSSAGSTAQSGIRRAALEKELDLSEVDDVDELLGRDSARPSASELGGLSEYRARAANGLEDEEGDPFTSIGGVPIGGPPIEEDLSIDPEDLGRQFLKGAVQDPRPLDPDIADIPSDRVRMSTGERRMREDVPQSGRISGELITRLPDGTDQEEALANKALEQSHRRHALKRRRSAR